MRGIELKNPATGDAYIGIPCFDTIMFENLLLDEPTKYIYIYLN